MADPYLKLQRLVAGAAPDEGEHGLGRKGRMMFPLDPAGDASQ
jgi:hypothetical protein